MIASLGKGSQWFRGVVGVIRMGNYWEFTAEADRQTDKWGHLKGKSAITSLCSSCTKSSFFDFFVVFKRVAA